MGARLVLWDVDGTLVRVGAVGREAFDVAVARVFGREVVGHGVAMAGKTDPQICREILTATELAVEEEVTGHLATVLEHLESELASSAERIRAEGRVLPGVEEVLSRLHDDPAILQSVLTGNTAANAAVKLSSFGLHRFLDLDIGAFGSDHHDRRELVPIAIGKARQLRGRSFSQEEVWVVGDTANDFACARAGGAHCVLVATGSSPVEELRGLGADAVFDDLSDVDRVVELLTG